MTALVAWREGMALSQQHLQQSDKFLLKHIKNVSGLPRGMHFGFGKLDFEEDLLPEGIFSVKECEAIFPSGISFIDSENKSVKIENRNFAQIFDKSQNSLDVFLALDAAQNSKVIWENYSDLYCMENSVVMPVSIPSPQIVFGGESMDGKEFLPLARVQRNLQGAFELDKNFYPPLIYLNSYEYFSQKLNFFNMLLQSKIENISHSKELLLRDLKILRAFLGSAQTVEGALPFTLFCEIAKFLQDSFTYNHFDFNDSFTNIFAKLNDFLNRENNAKFSQKLLSKQDEHLFFANVEAMKISSAASVWLAIETHEDAVKLIPSQIKIAAKSKLPNIMVSATHGINCVHSIAPKAIQEVPGTFYFKLQSWQDLCNEPEIGIYAPNSLRINSITLLVEI